MDDYNRLISSRILDGYEEMIDTVPQATMFGGKRMRKFVLPSSTEYDFPSSLSVGTMDGKYASTLGGAFYRDFNKGFPTGAEDLEGGVVVCHTGNPRRVGGKLKLGKIGKSLKKGFTKAGDVAKSAAFDVNKALKSSPVSRAIVYNAAPELAGEVARAGVTYYTGNPALGKVAAKGASSGTKAGLKSEGYGKGRGGVLIRDEPSQFHSSVYPPALASYHAQMPRGKDVYGRGRDAAPKPKRSNARGAIVAELMKKHSISLGEASKMVKEKGLY
jgi:hypothetical protein